MNTIERGDLSPPILNEADWKRPVKDKAKIFAFVFPIVIFLFYEFFDWFAHLDRD